MRPATSIVALSTFPDGFQLRTVAAGQFAHAPDAHVVASAGVISAGIAKADDKRWPHDPVLCRYGRSIEGGRPLRRKKGT